MMIETSTIRCPDQSIISYDDFVRQIVDEAFSDSEIAIGSDSQVLDTHVSFVTCICIHYPGRGGKFFFIKEIHITPQNHAVLNQIYDATQLYLQQREYLYL